MPTGALAAGYGSVELAAMRIAQAAFTGNDGTLLSAYTPDEGLGGFTVTGTGGANLLAIKTNRLWVPYGYAGGTNVQRQSARSTADVADDNFRVTVDYTRNTVRQSNLNRGGIYLLTHATGGSGEAREGVRVVFRGLGATTVDLTIERINNIGTIVQSSTLVAGFALALGASIRLGASVDGTTVTVYTEPAGGGAQTEQGALVLTADLRDGSHRRVGLSIWWEFATGTVDAGHFFDNLEATGASTSVGELRNIRLLAQREVLEAAPEPWMTSIPGQAWWSAQAEAFYVASDVAHQPLRGALMDGNLLGFTFYPNTSSTAYVWTGDGYFSDWSIGGSVHETVLTNLLIEGDGPLTEGS